MTGTNLEPREGTLAPVGDIAGARCDAIARRRWTYRQHVEPNAAQAIRTVVRPHWSVDFMGVSLDYASREAARREYAVLVSWWQAARPTCGHRSCLLDWECVRPELMRHEPYEVLRPIRIARAVAIARRDASVLPAAPA